MKPAIQSFVAVVATPYAVEASPALEKSAPPSLAASDELVAFQSSDNCL